MSVSLQGGLPGEAMVSPTEMDIRTSPGWEKTVGLD